MGWVKLESHRKQILAGKYRWYAGELEDAGYRLGVLETGELQMIVSAEGTFQTGYEARGTAALETGVWQHVAGVFDPQAQELRLYAYIQLNRRADGLRGYWTLDEAGGTRADTSGNGNHLTAYNTVGATTGQWGLAADLELSNQEYLSIAHTLQQGLAITGSLTLAGWIKPESLNSTMIMAAKYEYGVTNRAYRFDLRSGGQLGWLVSSDGLLDDTKNRLLSDAGVVAAGTWYHVAAVFDAQAQALRLYLDGAEIAAKSVDFTTMFVSSAPFMLGADVGSGSVVQHFDGLLDDWTIYDRALSRLEIAALMAPPAAPAALSLIHISEPTRPY